MFFPNCLTNLEIRNITKNPGRSANLNFLIKWEKTLEIKQT